MHWFGRSRFALPATIRRRPSLNSRRTPVVVRGRSPTGKTGPDHPDYPENETGSLGSVPRPLLVCSRTCAHGRDAENCPAYVRRWAEHTHIRFAHRTPNVSPKCRSTLDGRRSRVIRLFRRIAKRQGYLRRIYEEEGVRDLVPLLENIRKS